ncbi:MAG: MarR family transcriptional regulator [Clostridia bacterium]|nr:MarR family transcriptional regulator [Clostridia bacterium]
MTIRDVMQSGRMDFADTESPFFLIGLLSAFDNRFQAIADSTMKDISWKQFFAVICISMCREAPTVRELAQIMGCSHQNTKQILLKLERKGFVRIAPDEQDRRKQRIALTEECLAFCAQNDQAAMSVMTRLFDGVSREQLQTTIKTIIQIGDNLKEVHP